MNRDELKYYVKKISSYKGNNSFTFYFKDSIVYNKDLTNIQKYFLTMFTSLAFRLNTSIRRELSETEIIAFLLVYGYTNERAAKSILKKMVKACSELIEYNENGIIRIVPKFTYISKQDKYYGTLRKDISSFKYKEFVKHNVINEYSKPLFINKKTKQMNVKTQSAVASKLNLTQEIISKHSSNNNSHTIKFMKNYMWRVIEICVCKQEALNKMLWLKNESNDGSNYRLHKTNNKYAIILLIGSTLSADKNNSDKCVHLVSKVNSNKNRITKKLVRNNGNYYYINDFNENESTLLKRVNTKNRFSENQIHVKLNSNNSNISSIDDIIITDNYIFKNLFNSNKEKYV